MSTEKFLIDLLNRLAERLKDRLVLKGGMLLRLLESPRSTQDLDLAMLSKESKKVVAKEILSVLETLPALEITRQNLNSRGIFIGVRDRDSGVAAVLEIHVVPSLHLSPEPVSTAAISKKYDLGGRVVRIMAPAEAFSNKIAACLERGAGRDLYDLSLFEPMTAFDAATLLERLSKLEIDRTKPKRVTAGEAAEILGRRLETFTQARLKDEVLPLIPNDRHAGLLLLIRASVSRIIQRLRLLEQC